KGIGKGFARLDDGNQLFYGVPFRDSLTEDGYITDARGIPMHPHFRTLLQYGAVGGFGFYYDYGPNPSADAIIFARKGNIMYLPLIQKRVGGKYLVPGGMIKKDEDPIEAALRECYEETGLQVNNPKIILTVYNGLHASTPRKTLHAWEESAVRLFIPDDMEITNKSLQPADDAATAQWVPIHEAVTILSTSHRAYVKQAILLFEQTQNVTITSLGTIAER
ncbi:MAG TPA: NUDIX hydrolase, partial [Candidatus Saccharimonadales bacterium]|nr:NUDIX hydrolase [Candidatus Saccharimonadales bacterium]